MFRLTEPSPAQVVAFVDAQRGAAFSYPEVGATREGAAPAGYTVDHNRVSLGTGKAVFGRAVEALRAWRMASLGWSSVRPASVVPAPGATVAVVVRHYGFWSLHACRVVYAFDAEAGGVRRVGFAYGTLPDHGARGEERFAVEWHQSDDRVWYDLYAVSRPTHLLARAGYPLARRLQRRFGRDSKRAMAAAVRGDAVIGAVLD